MSINVLVRKKPDRDCYQLVYVDPVTRKDRTKSAKTNDLKEARLAAAKWQVELEQHGAHSGPVCWDSFVFRFRGEHLAALSTQTKRSYATALKAFVRLNGKPAAIGAITASVLSQYKAKLLTKYKSVPTVRNYLRHLLSALSWAKSVDMIKVYPKIKLPKLDKDTKEMRSRPITAVEFDHLIETTKRVRQPKGDAEKYERLLRGLLLSGLRIDEAENLDWEAGPIRLDLDGARHPRILLSIEGHKGRRSEILPVTPDFAEFMRQTPASQRRGKVFKVNTKARRVIAEIGRAAGIVVNDADGKCVSSHDLRRTFATYWSYRVRPIILQRLMRHRNIETTLRYYVSQAADDIGDELQRAAKEYPTATRI